MAIVGRRRRWHKFGDRRRNDFLARVFFFFFLLKYKDGDGVKPQHGRALYSAAGQLPNPPNGHVMLGSDSTRDVNHTPQPVTRLLTRALQLAFGHKGKWGPLAQPRCLGDGSRLMAAP